MKTKIRVPADESSVLGSVPEVGSGSVPEVGLGSVPEGGAGSVLAGS